MRTEEKNINFRVPKAMKRKIERIRRDRMKYAGHVSMSSLLREMLAEQIEGIIAEMEQEGGSNHQEAQ